MLLATALALLITGCSIDVYCSKQTGSSSTKGNHHPSFLRLELGRRKLSMQPKFVAAQKMLNRNPANIRKWIARFFITLGHLYSAKARIAHNNCMSCPSIWATLACTVINILLGSFQLFLHSDQPLSEGEIIPFSGVCQSGGGCIIHAGGGWWLHAPQSTDCFDVQPTTTSGNIITQSIIFSFLSIS